MIYDVIIIGAGVVGGAVARELSRYNLSVVCLEKEADVCCGTSKANTGIIHTPALVPSGTHKGVMTAAGAAKFAGLSSELGFTYQKCGSLVLAFRREDEQALQKYIRNSEENYRQAGFQPPEYRILRGAELFSAEPELNREVVCALHAADTGRIIPYEYGIALWENAVENGVELKLNQPVLKLARTDENGGLWLLSTPAEEYRGRYVINASGHGSSGIGIEAGFDDGRIQKVKGQYLILDRQFKMNISRILFQVPRAEVKKNGKGILVTETVYGNIMIGPDARRQEDGSDTSTDLEALDEVVRGALLSVPGLDPAACIKTFAGVRPRPAGGDFIIEHKNNFIHLCGIESPGLTSSPAIAVEVLDRLKSMGLNLQMKSVFRAERRPIIKSILTLSPDRVNERIKLPAGNPERLICRCEQVPEERIIDSLGRGLPVTTIDGIKRRTRAGQGSCQGGFCGNRVRAVMAGHLGVPESEITQRGSEPELERVPASAIKKRFAKRQT